MVACSALVAAAFAVASPWRERSYANVSPARSAYLRGVVEPITMVDGISWDDGGSNGLSFKDLKGQQFAVCLMDDLDGDQRLRFGSIIPREGQAVPIGGIEERAFLRLLERWVRQSPGGKAWTAKVDAWRRTNRQHSIFRGDESDAERGDAFAVFIMNRLRRRN